MNNLTNKIPMISFFLWALLMSACTTQSNKISEPTAKVIFEADSTPEDFDNPVFVDKARKVSEYLPADHSNLNPDRDKEIIEDVVLSQKEIEVTDQTPIVNEAIDDTVTSEQEETTQTAKNYPDSLEVEVLEILHEEIPEVIASIDHSTWNAFLKKYVSSKGKVHYSGMLSDIEILDNYLEVLSSNAPSPSWSRSEEFAYWINVYNAFTIKLILNNYPVNSIMDIDQGKAWDKRWIKIGELTYTLNEIEKDKLLKKYKDPRIHFAVNCAASSCPPILNKAWTKNNLESQLEERAIAFIRNTTYNVISPNSIRVSKIFEWYSSDFGALINYLNKYSATTIKTNAEVNFLEYDWSLNK